LAKTWYIKKGFFMSEYVVLVDAHDNPVGIAEKMKAHQEGLLHRAFSIIVFNSAGKMLVHQRTLEKYHSGGLWTNACCSHPRPGESMELAIHRRLQEEMGFDCSMQEIFSLEYRAVITESNLIEHEYVHVFYGISDVIPNPDPNEVNAFLYVDPDWLVDDVKNHSERYTAWFNLIVARIVAYHKEQQTHDCSFEQKSF